MTLLARWFLRSAWTALGGLEAQAEDVEFVGESELDSVFPVTDFAAGAVGAAGVAVRELVHAIGGRRHRLVIDRGLAAGWFAGSLRPVGWRPPPSSDPLTGDYRAKDGWIRLHANAAHHRAAALRVLETTATTKEVLARKVIQWTAQALEDTIVEDGGCAARMRSIGAWAEHPQGAALAIEPLVHFADGKAADAIGAGPTPGRPLAGIRVLDLTRVLAGPVATRFLAGFGADVLRLDPPGWDEPGLAPEVMLGKRAACVDLRSTSGRATFEGLLAGADVLIHGLRPGALEGLGYEPITLRAIAPGLVDVSLDAYGWTGPWAGRRGFDSLVQMSAGVADAGMRIGGAATPVPLPCQALDHATGYLMAAAAIVGLERRIRERHGMCARLSLARTAKLLLDAAPPESRQAIGGLTDADISAGIEQTAWGPARRLNAPINLDGTPMAWFRPASALGSAKPEWKSWRTGSNSR